MRLRTIDESAKFNFEQVATLRSIKIFRPRNMVGQSIKKAKLYYDDDSYEEIKFRGLFEWEEVEISPKRTKSVELVVEEVFDPKLNWLYLYEIEFYGDR